MDRLQRGTSRQSGRLEDSYGWVGSCSISNDIRLLQYVPYGVRDGYRFVRIADGSTVPFELHCDGRLRWIPDGRAIAFTDRDENGLGGVFVQEFIPGEDTSKTRRKLAVFFPDLDG